MPTSTTWKIIVNLTAGSNAQRKWSQLEQQLHAATLPFDVCYTKSLGHAMELARDAVAEGYTHFVAVGGDGTVHEVANGLLSQAHRPPDELVLSAFATGTGNDWVRTYGIPTDTWAWTDYIQQGHPTPTDVGHLQYHTDAGDPRQRYFINVAGMAYDAFLVQEAQQRPGFGIARGLTYYYLILKCLMKYDLRPAHIDFDGQRITEHCYTINVGICKYSGGGMQLVPHAVPDDGLLALTIAGKLSRPEVIRATPALFSGKALEVDKVSGYQTTDITVTAADPDHPLMVEADGEWLGYTPCRFGILPNALQVWVR